MSFKPPAGRMPLFQRRFWWLFIILIAGSAGLAWLFCRDADSLRPQASQAVSQALQRPVLIRGPLRFSLWPIGLQAADILVCDPACASPLLQVGEVTVGIDVWQALHGRWVVTRIDADSIRLRLQRENDGSSNIDDLLRVPDVPGRLGWDVQRMRVRDVGVVIDDRLAGQRSRIQRAAFEAQRAKPGLPLQWLLSGSIEHPHATGSLKLSGDMAFDRPQQRLNLPNLTLAWLGQAEGARTVLEVRGDFAYRQRLAQLQHGKIRFDATRGETRLQINGELPEAFWHAGRLAAPQLVLRGSLARPRHTGTLQIDWRNLAAAEQGVRADSTIRFAATQDSRELQLQLRGPMYWLTDQQRFQLAGNELQAVLRHLGQAQPAAQLQLTGDAALDWPRQQMNATLAGMLDRAPMRITADLSDFGAPHLRLDADIARLNLTPFLFAADPLPAADPQAPASSALRLDVSWLEGWRAQGALRVGQMQIGRLQLQQVQLGLRAGDGRLSLDPLMARLYEGTLLGAASLRFAPQPVIHVRQSLARMNVAPLFRDLIGTDRLEGSGDLKLDLTVQGGDLDSIKRGLDGKVELILHHGALRGINLGLAVGLAGAGRARTEQSADPSARTEFTSLQASFAIAQGVAKTDDLQLNAPLLQLTGEGRIDWPADRLDYRLLARLQAGQGKVDLRGVQIPVSISGPLARPRYSADLRPLVERLARLASRPAR